MLHPAFSGLEILELMTTIATRSSTATITVSMIIILIAIIYLFMLV